MLDWSQGNQLDTPSLQISASLFALWLHLGVQGTYIVECRVSIFGIVIMIWESIPIILPRKLWVRKALPRKTVSRKKGALPRIFTKDWARKQVNR